MIGSLAVGVGGASAALEEHSFSTTFAGSGTTALSSPVGVAVDNSSGGSAGDVYVTDPANERVEKFDATGKFILMFGRGVNKAGGDVCTAASAKNCQAGSEGSAPGQFTAPSFVAVDPTTGDVYVGESSYASPIVQKFDPAGKSIASWGGAPAAGQLDGSASQGGPFGLITGIAVDSAGHLYVESGAPRVFEFAPNGSAVGSFPVQRGGSIGGLAVGNGYVYTANGDAATYDRVATDGEEVGQVNNGGTQGGIGVAPSTGDVFVSNGSSVDRFHFLSADEVLGGGRICTITLYVGCEPTETFGSGHLTGSRGVAISAKSGQVYVADQAGHQVAVFGRTLLPEARTGVASEVDRTAATLSGLLDPAGGPDFSACHFEYGKDTNYESGAIACSPGPPYSGETAVSAAVSDLAVETTYHFRLVGTVGGKTIDGVDGTFATDPAVAGVTTGPASNASLTSLKLNGSYLGDGVDTSYFFEYGSTGSYGQTTAAPPGVDNGDGTGPQSVSAIASGIQTNHIYHYRLVAHNSFGYDYGADQTVLAGPPTLPRVDTTSVAAVGSTTAILAAEIDPGNGPLVYRFEYGLTSEYGARTFPLGPLAPPAGGDVSAEAEVAGLTPGASYHFRVRATNFSGTTTGPDQTFATSGGTAETAPAVFAPPVFAPAPSSLTCKKGFVKKKSACVKKKKHRKHRRHRDKRRRGGNR